MSDRPRRGVKKVFSSLLRGSGSKKRRAAPSDDDYSPSQSATADASEFGQSTNEVEMDEVHGEDLLFDPTQYEGEKKVWISHEYYKARQDRAYDQLHDSPTPQFYTQVQHDAFYGLLMDKSVFTHKYTDWSYIAKFPTVSPLIEKFQNLGLHAFMAHKQDWNETVIRQFYATVEIDFVAKNLTWMTNSRRFNATFAEFAEANKINYALTAGKVDVLEMPMLPEREWVKYYVADPQQIKLGFVNGLLYMPKVINKIVRMTFYPKAGNSDAIREYYWNIMEYIMQGTVFDVVVLMMKEIESYTMAVRASIYYAPYIMSLVLFKSNFPTRALYKRHPPYQPFSSKKQELIAPPEEPADNEAEEAHDEAVAPEAPPVAPAPQIDWSQMPPPPPQFFSGLGTYMDQYFQPVMQRLDQVQASHVEARNSYEAARTSYEAARTSIDALTTRMQTLETNYDALASHIYGYFPAPMPPQGFYYPGYAPPPPPPQDD